MAPRGWIRKSLSSYCIILCFLDLAHLIPRFDTPVFLLLGFVEAQSRAQNMRTRGVLAMEHPRIVRPWVRPCASRPRTTMDAQTWSVGPNTLPSIGRKRLFASRSASNAGHRSSPWRRVARQTWFYGLVTEPIERIRNRFGPGICADDEFWASRADALYVTLIELDAAISIAPVSCNKRDRRGWVSLRSRQLVFDFP